MRRKKDSEIRTASLQGTTECGSKMCLVHYSDWFHSSHFVCKLTSEIRIASLQGTTESYKINKIIMTYILVINHLHESQLTESSLSIRLILEWLHQLLNGYPFSLDRIKCRAKQKMQQVKGF